MTTHDILIVDDEFYICEGLSKKIQQLGHPHIGQIRTCLSGETAIELCKTYKPHIVFTDIKMGGINGIELIHSLSEKLHPVQFIVLSGYDDFHYVRGAFQNGAIDYLLKPVINEDLNQVLSIALLNLENIPSNPGKLRSHLFQFSADIIHKITVLPSSMPLDSSLLAALEHIGIHESCCIALLAAQQPQPHDTMIQYCNRIYDTFGRSLCAVLSDSKLGILCDIEHYQALLDFLSAIVNVPDSPWAASLTPPAAVTEVSRTFQNAEQMLCMRLFTGYGKLYTKIPQVQNVEFSQKLKHLVSQFLENPSLISIGTQRIAFYKEIEKLNLPEINNFFHFFNDTINFSLLNSGAATETFHVPSFFDFYTRAELFSYFHQCLTTYARICAHIKHLATPMELIRNYIDLHYMENLTLTDLAERFFLSYSYLSKSFHRTFHMSFHEYLRMLRMEHALLLLKNPELTIQQIASRVGYENAFNFSRSFKAQYGISPTQFRQNITTNTIQASHSLQKQENNQDL